MASMEGEEGDSDCSFESMSSVTRPEMPKAVVWYRFGKVSLAQRRISRGVRALRVVLRNFRCSFVRIIEGRVPAEEEPEA